ncbi:hypothetical protein R3W88_027122 [Solanum pinnatisectum]|uniref:Uncharacterized protein n=1 Tax=Solanum pinnatisectum TaxID=50273 RepID=A0AAV9LG02_9SOLN|nr:hypothetical protein R3W88_027122 [Solanum pinnatisectum]
MKYFVCKTLGHNKKGCPTLVSVRPIIASTSVERPTSATSTGVRRATASTFGERHTSATSTGVRPTISSTSKERPTSATLTGVRPATNLLSTQQSTSSVAGQKRKSNTTLKSGTTLGYKIPRQKKYKNIHLCTMLHSPTLTGSTPTNIDLGYKFNGLRWKRRVAITQRKLREESYRRAQANRHSCLTKHSRHTLDSSLFNLMT